jgi:hypothetical protein
VVVVVVVVVVELDRSLTCRSPQALGSRLRSNAPDGSSARSTRPALVSGSTTTTTTTTTTVTLPLDPPFG